MSDEPTPPHIFNAFTGGTAPSDPAVSARTHNSSHIGETMSSETPTNDEEHARKVLQHGGSGDTNDLLGNNVYVAERMLAYKQRAEAAEARAAEAEMRASQLLVDNREIEDRWSDTYARMLRAEVRAETAEQAATVLQRLVDLKDGPRDSPYYSQKPMVWEDARHAAERHRQALTARDETP